MAKPLLIGYLAKGGKVTDWHGKPIGSCHIVSTWKTPRAYVSSTMSAVECTVGGKVYIGRTAGESMAITGRIKRGKGK